MSQDDYTPARMRELADEGEAHAMGAPIAMRLAAALRAAADCIVSLESQSNATQIAYQTAAQHLADALNEAERLTAALAAREALVKRAEPAVIDARNRALSVGCASDAAKWRALAAEIAAALGERNDG